MMNPGPLVATNPVPVIREVRVKSPWELVVTFATGLVWGVSVGAGVVLTIVA